MLALPLSRAGAEARDHQGASRRRRQDLALLPAAHRHREARLLQGSRPRRRDFGFRGRRALAAGPDGRQRRCGHRLVRSHHPDPGQGRADRRAGADGPLPGLRARAAQGEGRRLQEPEGSQGHEDRRHGAGLLDALHGALHDGAGRAEAGGCLVHRHRLRQHRACRREARRGRRDLQRRSDDQHSRPRRRDQDRRRHAHARKARRRSMAGPIRPRRSTPRRRSPRRTRTPRRRW